MTKPSKKRSVWSSERRRAVRLPTADDEAVRLLLGDESADDSIKSAELERQKAKLRAVLDAGCPGWQEAIEPPVEIRTCRGAPDRKSAGGR